MTSGRSAGRSPRLRLESGLLRRVRGPHAKERWLRRSCRTRLAAERSRESRSPWPGEAFRGAPGKSSMPPSSKLPRASAGRTLLSVLQDVAHVSNRMREAERLVQSPIDGYRFFVVAPGAFQVVPVSFEAASLDESARQGRQVVILTGCVGGIDPFAFGKILPTLWTSWLFGSRRLLGVAQHDAEKVSHAAISSRQSREVQIDAVLSSVYV